MSNLSAIERALRIAQERSRTPKAYAAGGSTDQGLFSQIGQYGSDVADALRFIAQSGLPIEAYQQAIGMGQTPEAQPQARDGLAGTAVEMAPETFGLGPEQIPVAMGGRDLIAVSEDDAGNLYNQAGEVIGNRLQVERRLDEEARAGLEAASWAERPVAKATGYLPESAQEATSLGATLLAMPEIMAGAGKQYFDTRFPKPEGRDETTLEGLTRGVGRLASVPSALVEGITHTGGESGSRLYGEFAGERPLTDEERARATFDLVSLLPFATAATGAARHGLVRGADDAARWRAPEARSALTPEESLANLTRSDAEAQAAFDAHLAERAEQPAIAMDTTAMDERMGLQRAPSLFSGKDEAAIPGIVTSAARDTGYSQYRDFMAKHAPDKAPMSWPEHRLGVIKGHIYDINLHRDPFGRLDPENQAYKDRLLAEARAIRKEIKAAGGVFSNKDEAAIPGVSIAAGREPVRAYHWTDTPDISPDNRFQPFSHFGTAEAANDRFVRPAGRFSVGDLQRQEAEPGSVVGGATYPVDLDIKNPLRIEDVGTHSPITLAYEINRALDPDGPSGEIPGIVEDVLERQVDALSDAEVQALGQQMELDWYYDEFNVPREDVDRMRSWIKDDIQHNVQDTITSGDDDVLGALVVYGRALDEVAGPESKAVALEAIGGLLEGEGYDGLVYRNFTEGDGSDSYIATHPGTVRSATSGRTLFSNKDEAAIPGVVVSSDPKVRAAQKRAADVPFEDKLAVQHNMRGRSFDHNLRSYEGDIPVPSLAISKAGQPLTNFGDISLFGSPEMAVPKGSSPVYPADAYTKRAPKIVRDVPRRADADRMMERLTGEKGAGWKLNLEDPYWDENFRLGFLRSQGKEPPAGVDIHNWARNAISYEDRPAMEAFVDDFLNSHQGIIRERIDLGWSDDGDRRIYKPHTLDNMVKASKGKAGSEDFDYGPNAWRAHVMRPFQSLAEIQENRGLINRVPKEEVEALKREITAKGFTLTEAMGYRDTYADMVLDGLRSPDPDVRQLAKDLREDLQRLPTEYFEAKPQRAVGLDEFKVAAVPESMPQVARELDQRGLDVRTYDRSKMGEEGEALTEILRSRPDLLFSQSDEAAVPGIVTSASDKVGSFSTTSDGKLIGYRVVNLDENGRLVSQADSRVSLDPQGDHATPMWVSNDPGYVMDNYGHGVWGDVGEQRQALVAYAFDPSDVLQGALDDAQPEVSIGRGRVLSVKEIGGAADADAFRTPDLFSNREDAATPAIAAAADRMRRNQPFYGEDVGPKGRIGDPQAEAERLALSSGVAGAPSPSGFFNPATSALLQQGVAPKQTLAYYKKQMGARGGKLPPGMWDRVTEGLRPSDVIERDWLVQRIDEVAPQMDVRLGVSEYQDYATRGPFQNYSETTVGYPSKDNMIPLPSLQARDKAVWDALNAEIREARDEVKSALYRGEGYENAHARLEQLELERERIAQAAIDESWKKAGVGEFRDSHFAHPNIEGWYRTQDTADKTRILEEVQPQRQERLRERGIAKKPEEMRALREEEGKIKRDLDPIFLEAVAMSGRGLAPSFDAHGVSAIRMALEQRSMTASAQGDHAASAAMLAKSRELAPYQEKLANIEGQIQSSLQGVEPSPFSHDVNAATDILLKNAVRDAVTDDMEALAWTPGEVQAKRYGQVTHDVMGLRYSPETKMFQVLKDGHWSSGARDGTLVIEPNELARYIGDDMARQLLAAKKAPMGGGSPYSAHTLNFSKGVTIGGEGMKGYYGSGPSAEGGILPARIKSLGKQVTGKEPAIEQTRIGKSYASYPKVELTPEFKDKARRIGLSLYANDEKAGLLAAAVAGSKIPKEIDALGFYSPSLEAIKNIPQQKGTVAQFRAMILDKKYGGKPKELEAVGFDKAFPDKAAKVTRQQVEDFLRKNRIELGEERYGYQQALDADEKGMLSYLEDRHFRSGDLTDEEWDIYRDLKARADELLKPRYERYSTPGGVSGSYQEVVTKLPTEWDRIMREVDGLKDADGNIRPENVARYRELNKQANQITESNYTSAHWPGITNPLLHYRTKDFRGEKLPLDHPLVAPEVEQYKREGKFDPSQYVPPRGTTRLVDELQSDWAQRGRDQGFRDPARADLLIAELKQAEDEHLAITRQIEAIENEQILDDLGLRYDDDIGGLNGFAIQRAIDSGGPDAQQLKSFQDQIIALSRKRDEARNRILDLSNKVSAAKHDGVPSAPYISNTSDWVDLGLRQALTEAARDPSVTRLAWTPGDVQNRRYNLSSHVDEITVRPQMDGTRTLHIDMPERGTLRFTVDKDGVITGVPAGMAEARGRPVTELIGEELAPRVMQANRAQVIRGADLDIGGEGQKGFYGVLGPDGTVIDPGIVGRRLLDLVKKIDPEAAQIGAASVADNRYPSIPLTPKLRQHILDEGMSLFANRDEAMLPGLLPALDASDGPVTVNEIVDIPTPPNRVLEGGFYSVLDENIANSPMKAGTAQQWLNAAKKGEQAAKDSEIKWRALDRFLASRKPNEKFTKEEIQTHLDQNKVEVSRRKNTEDGFDPEFAREREIENVRDNLQYLNEDEIFDRYGFRVEPVLSKRMRETYDKLRIEPVGNLDFFSDEPLYQVVDENGEVLSRGYETPEEARSGALKDAERIAQQRAIADYEARTEQAWEGEPLDGLEGWDIFDKDGNAVGDRIYESEELARDARYDLIVDKEQDYVYGLSDEDLANLTGDEFEGYRERTKRYLKDVPRKGAEYVEDVLVTDPKTIARLGSKGWPKNPGDLHPDARYENAPGWTLRETYGSEGLGRGSGIALHEIQSRWGQAGEGQGWRSAVSPKDLEALRAARDEANAKAEALEDQYARYVRGPHSRASAYRVNVPSPDSERAAVASRARNWLMEIDDALYGIERRKADNESMIAQFPEGGYGSMFQRNNQEIAKLQESIALGENLLSQMESEGLISRVSPEEVADPNSPFNAWNKEREAAKLRIAETRNALESAVKGVDPGPFVDDQAAFPLLLKQALIDAVEEGRDWVALSGPSRIAKRWGQRGAEDKYEKAAPNILGKLAKMHDKGAKVEQFYPGGFDKPSGFYDPTAALTDAEAVGQADFGFGTSHVKGYAPGLTSSTRPIKEVALRKDYAGNADYKLVADDGSWVGSFQTREAAERAMQTINEKLSEQRANRAKVTPEDLAQAWKDDRGEPYSGVRLSPQMRESIRRRGFPLFANKDEAALPGIVTSAAGEKPLKELTQRQLDDLGLYSHLGETLDTLQMKNAVPLKWRSELKKQGVKDEELRWTGMDTWLASLPPNDKVPIEALKTFFAENKVKLEKHVAESKGYTEEGVRDYARENVETPDYTVGPDPEWIKSRIREHTIDLDEETGAYRVADEFGQDVEGGFASPEEAKMWLREKIEEDADSGDYDSYAIFDLSGERLDGDYSRSSAENAAYERAQEDVDYMVNESLISDLREQYDLPLQEESSEHLSDRIPGGRDYEEHLVTVPRDVLRRGGVQKPGIDAHFRDDLDNVLGWNLMERYEDIPTGGKIRNIHENQSDWGQRGVEKGFAKASQEEIRAAEEASVLAEDALRDEQAKFVEIPGGGVARILTGSVRDSTTVKRVLGDLRDMRRDMEQTEKDIANIESTSNDYPGRIRLDSLRRRQVIRSEAILELEAKLAELAPRYRLLDFSEEGMSNPGALEDIKAYSAWMATVNDLALKSREARQAYNALAKGVAEGPFVTDTSDWTRLLLKNALYEAAKRGDKYLSWSDAQTLIDRWGHEEGMTKHYNEVIPNVALKLAKEHDPQAKLTDVFPGKPFSPSAHLRENENIVMGGGYRDPQLPLYDTEDPAIRAPFDGRYGPGRTLDINQTRKIDHVVAVPENYAPGDKRLVYQMVVKTPSGGEVRLDPHFRSKEAAEKAMALINEKLERGGRPTKDEILAEIADENYESDYKLQKGIEITDKMRESIKKRGFRMFANEREAFLASIAPALSDREAKIERALKIAGAKKPKSRLDIN